MNTPAKHRLPEPKDSPEERWNRLADLLRICTVSTRVSNVPAPLNLILVGPPGDGKSEMLMRVQHLTFVRVLSDASYMGLMNYLGDVKDGSKSALLIPDLATIVGRKSDVARQTIATMATMCAEGVYRVAVGKILRDFGGIKSSILTAITDREFSAHLGILGQNAFLSRCFVCDFNLEMPELEHMMRQHINGNRRLTAPVKFPEKMRRGQVVLPRRKVEMAPRLQELCIDWWKELKAVRPDMFYGFRSGHAVRTLLMSAAYLRGGDRVTNADVAMIERVWPLLMRQVQTVREDAK